MKPNAICAYSRFTVYVDTEMTTLVGLDSLSVISPLAPCAYTIDTRASCLITGPEGCGVVTISNFLRYGDVPDLAIHPNPASESINLSSEKPLGLITIEISDELGIVHVREDRTMKTRTELIGIQVLPSGKYNFHIIGNSFATTLGLVISR